MSPAMNPRYTSTILLCLLIALTGFASAQAPASSSAVPKTETEKLSLQGQKLIGEGKEDEAIVFYKDAFQKHPEFWQAYMGIGAALDLKGDYSQAQESLQKAIDVAPDAGKIQALRTIAVSYAFQCNTAEVAKYEQQAYDKQMAAGSFVAAAGTADELARIYLECGDPDNAQKWYQTGHDTALRDTRLTDAEKDLWAFRWENAQARIAARRGQKAEAQQHVAAAKAIIDKGTNPDQAQFVPYLEGYVAFYGGDYPSAISDLQKANQKDPFILVLMAQAYEKWGDQKNAMDYYRKVLQINAHSPTNAFARPLAQKKVAAGG